MATLVTKRVANVVYTGIPMWTMLTNLVYRFHSYFALEQNSDDFRSAQNEPNPTCELPTNAIYHKDEPITAPS